MTFTDIKSGKKNVKLFCFVLLLTAFLCGCKSSVQETMTQEAKTAEKEEELETAAAETEEPEVRTGGYHKAQGKRDFCDRTYGRNR